VAPNITTHFKPNTASPPWLANLNQPLASPRAA
jgi:hypothetical protein